MKRKIYLAVILFISIWLSGCFEDKGNYDYDKSRAPLWFFDLQNSTIRVNCNAGEMAVFDASTAFTWGKDSAIRNEEVRYEWKLRNVLIGEGMKFEIPTYELMKKIGMNKFKDEGLTGSFCIIEKATGITHMARIYVQINPVIGHRDWMILSDNNGKAKVSFIKYKKDNPKFYDLKDNYYEQANGEDIPGKPMTLVAAPAKGVGALGSTTVITDQVAYELNNENLLKVDEIKNQFLDGTPPDFKMVNRRDVRFNKVEFTIVATEDGRLFSRQMSENNFGGKFLTEPYIIDENDYKITLFGLTRLETNNVPCYDELNRRVVMINSFIESIQTGPNPWDITSVIRHRIVPLVEKNIAGIPPVWNMPQGTKVLALTEINYEMDIPRNSSRYDIVYNDEAGNTYWGDFVVDQDSATLQSPTVSIPLISFPGGNLTDDAILLFSASKASKAKPSTKMVLYTKGNEVRFYQRDEQVDYLFGEAFPTKVTCLAYDWIEKNQRLLVGCENGDIYFYNISDIKKPVLINSMRVEGKVISAKELGVGGTLDDAY